MSNILLSMHELRLPASAVHWVYLMDRRLPAKDKIYGHPEEPLILPLTPVILPVFAPNNTPKIDA